jgi:hypothetical protein
MTDGQSGFAREHSTLSEVRKIILSIARFAEITESNQDPVAVTYWPTVSQLLTCPPLLRLPNPNRVLVPLSTADSSPSHCSFSSSVILLNFLVT